MYIYFRQGFKFKNLIKKSRDYNFPINIKLVISNNSKAKGILYAKLNSIPYIIVNADYRNHEYKILNKLKECNISLICLAGYMKIISKNFLNLYRKKIINIHPSLLPKFKGLNTFSRILEKKEVKTGCTVHFVNEKLDSGNIIVQKFFYLNKLDNEKSVKTKILTEEYLAFPRRLLKFVEKINF